MPFSGPQGQGPFDDHSECVDAMADEDGIDDAEALCAVWERQAADAPATKLRFDELSRQRLLAAAADNPDLVRGGLADAGIAQKHASPMDVVGPSAQGLNSLSQKEDLDPEALDDDAQEALEADDFVVYGKASIEQYDVEDQRITMEALTDALDRFFDSEDAPGIISRGHTDVPVGRPLREHTLDADTTLVIDGERYEYEAGDTLRTEAKDADDDGLPELWLVSRLANDSELARETRLKALQGELNGFSVTVYPKDGEATAKGEDVTDLDLHAVTIGTDEQIKNKGSEFDVAEFKALAASGSRAIDSAAQTIADALGRTHMEDDDTKTLLGRLLQRSGEELEQEAQTDGTDTDTESAGDAGDESLASTIFNAVEEGKLTAQEAEDLAAVEKAGDAVPQVIDAISEDDLDVDEAVELLGAIDGAGGDGPAGKGDYGDDEGEDDEHGDEKADTGDDPDADPDADQKAGTREVAERMADEFDIPVDEVMAYLDNLEMEGEKDDAGELKAAAIVDGLEETIEETVEAKLDEHGAASVDEGEVEDVVDQKLENLADALDDEVLTKSRFDDLIQDAEVVGSPVPTQGDTDGETTLGDVITSTGGAD